MVISVDSNGGQGAWLRLFIEVSASLPDCAAALEISSRPAVSPARSSMEAARQSCKHPQGVSAQEKAQEGATSGAQCLTA